MDRALNTNVITKKIELRILKDIPFYLDQDGTLIERKMNFVVDSTNNVYDYNEYTEEDFNGEPKQKLKLVGEIIVYDGDDYKKYKGTRMVKLGFF
jgi:hypothetical protein